MNNSYLYTGKPINPAVVLNVGDKVLKKGIDYDVFITDNVNVGTAHIKIVGKGKFFGTMNHTFEIEPIDVKKLSFYSDSNVYSYTGKPVEMEISVQFGDILLYRGKDYNIEYFDNLKPGRAYAKMTFYGNFTGVMNIPFIITDKFVNESVLSDEQIEFGKSITVNAQTHGGIGPYQYSYYIKSKESSKWTALAYYSANNKFKITPNHIEDYDICVKIKDATGQIAKKYLEFSVFSKVKCVCTLSSEKVSLNEPVTVSVKMLNGKPPFSFYYFVIRKGDSAWTNLKVNKKYDSATFTPHISGTYKICVKVTDADLLRTKEYMNFTVE